LLYAWDGFFRDEEDSMVVDMALDDDSLSISIDDPHHADIPALVKRIEEFAVSKSATVRDLDLMGLMPRLIRGIAGCEGGCPADAKSLVREGFGKFDLRYIEGGILSASIKTGSGQTLWIKIFPDF
jgi:hypothetical protein